MLDKSKLIIFAREKRAQGLSWKDITKAANAAGFRTPTGMEWRTCNLNMLMLKNAGELRVRARRRSRRKNNKETFPYVETYAMKNTMASATQSAIEVILSTKTIPMADRLNLAQKLLSI